MKERYSYHTKFKIKDESGLDDFWSFVVFRLNIQESQVLYERFSSLYTLLLDYKYSLEKKVTLFIYENEDYFFLKVKTNHIEILEKLRNKLIKSEYEFSEDRNAIEYAIEKHKHVPVVVQIKEVIKEVSLGVITFVDYEDQEDILNIIEKMQARNYSRMSPTLFLGEIHDYRAAFSHFSSITKNYIQLKTISNVIGEISVVLSLYSEKCLENTQNIRLYLESFINSLSIWFMKLFIEGCDGCDFMDNSFIADLAQFKLTLDLYDEIDEGEACSLDDIFDF